MEVEKYQELVEEIKDKYEQRIVDFLESIRDAFQRDGYESSEVGKLSDEEFRWEFYVHIASKPGAAPDMEDIDFVFRIDESETYRSYVFGVNFSLDIVKVGGEIVGGISPYNYTPQVWVDVDDPDAIEERFEIVESAIPEEIRNFVLEQIGAD